ncbi:DBH-like monooxygenase protein 1 homolog [Ostrea edulis]|uniref:DBH-like monooxygenase protein 1 homolog n=1 Tax=Ostrea edulis TaxID=37623 RepID=UPI0024AEBA8B|nr:DBH-like monooxygenase protein 1 homolog [Ostrea edulis]
MLHLISLVYICLFLSGIRSQERDCPYKPTATEKFPYMLDLSDNGEYFLFWKFNDSHITFEVHAKTHGYVGFGLSTTGRMYPADVVTGWVKPDGSAVFTDRFSSDHILPEKDDSQDYTLLKAEENEFGTILKFFRILDTCDSKDIAVSHDTLRVIYAYHPDDPDSEDSIPYHGGSRRGFKSVRLLEARSKIPPLPEDVKYFDFLNGINGENNLFKLPPKDTFYHCTTFNMPDIGGKRHVIRYDPVLTPGNEKIVHHIVLYRCRGEEPKYAHKDYDCYGLTKEYRPECRSVFLMYEIGAGSFIWPEYTGLSLGAEGDPTFFVMETHYSNPDLRDDILDNSGIRIFYTNHLRQHEAGVMETGMEITLTQFIPPHETSFLSQGICSTGCLKLGLPNGTDEIKVFALFHHSHLLANGMKTRLIRNGVEQPPIANDENYDFNFQAANVLQKEITIKSGDSLIIECNYESTSRTNVTMGGLSIREEMCLSFLMYYPRITVDACLSSPAHDAPSDFAIDQMTSYLKHVDHHYDEQMGRLNSLVNQIDWKDSRVRDKFKNKSRMSGFDNQCFYKGKKVLGDYFRRPEVKAPYIKPKSKCEN